MTSTPTPVEESITADVEGIARAKDLSKDLMEQSPHEYIDKWTDDHTNDQGASMTDKGPVLIYKTMSSDSYSLQSAESADQLSPGQQDRLDSSGDSGALDPQAERLKGEDEEQVPQEHNKRRTRMSSESRSDIHLKAGLPLCQVPRLASKDQPVHTLGQRSQYQIKRQKVCEHPSAIRALDILMCQCSSSNDPINQPRSSLKTMLRPISPLLATLVDQTPPQSSVDNHSAYSKTPCDHSLAAEESANSLRYDPLVSDSAFLLFHELYISPRLILPIISQTTGVPHARDIYGLKIDMTVVLHREDHWTVAMLQQKDRSLRYCNSLVGTSDATLQLPQVLTLPRLAHFRDNVRQPVCDYLPLIT